MFDLKAQRRVLKRRHGHCFDVLGQLALRHRLVAFGKAANGQQRYDKRGRT